MIKESEDYIKEFGRTNDTILAIIMFWMVISDVYSRRGAIELDYFNSKMERYLDIISTNEQMVNYLSKMNVSIHDKNKDIRTLIRVIDCIVEVYDISEIDYQLHMYGPTTDKSGDYWISNRDELMNQIGDIFSIICSSNGVSMVLADEMEFLTNDIFKELNRYYNIEKLLI